MSVTVRDLQRRAAQAGLPRLEAQLLLCALLDKDRGWLISHDEDPLPPGTGERFEDWLRQRLDEVPLAYLTGHKEFHGLRLQVSPATLVPRPDTEVLVDAALRWLASCGLAAPRVLDLGTGSGAIALAVKKRHPRADVTATDFSAAALGIAEANARQLGLEVRFLLGAWWQPLGEEGFDLVMSNPPYIAPQDEHLPALRHEPLSALAAPEAGLADLRQIIGGAPAHLRPGGLLLLEHGYDQEQAVADLLRAAGLQYRGCERDLGGQPRCSAALRP
ncbi:peptide chain release factor N(5)-glutamine methyltransferase [Mitsuaria sp. WAJ17]|uniref:peptide chain release factor N(5)-glutamine methyltransferase n=1 Tax=Mitsuaria sp. WAJ17 TaxID=2761452 RepID=UPI0016035D48|nr:peptide chain release factor N(5)-glutamine methyltransferase [Mitsuaria sp. WAJ17]MBB2484855.1 peptide chain release factor N(5)-glutamine methyltransferase [Mitsuaria sp. WAJ17]